MGRNVLTVLVLVLALALPHGQLERLDADVHNRGDERRDRPCDQSPGYMFEPDRRADSGGGGDEVGGRSDEVARAERICVT